LVRGPLLHLRDRRERRQGSGWGHDVDHARIRAASGRCHPVAKASRSRIGRWVGVRDFRTRSAVIQRTSGGFTISIYEDSMTQCFSAEEGTCRYSRKQAGSQMGTFFERDSALSINNRMYIHVSKSMCASTRPRSRKLSPEKLPSFPAKV